MFSVVSRTLCTSCQYIVVYFVNINFTCIFFGLCIVNLQLLLIKHSASQRSSQSINTAGEEHTILTDQKIVL